MCLGPGKSVLCLLEDRPELLVNRSRKGSGSSTAHEARLGFKTSLAAFKGPGACPLLELADSITAADKHLQMLLMHRIALSPFYMFPLHIKLAIALPETDRFRTGVQPHRCGGIRWRRPSLASPWLHCWQTLMHRGRRKSSTSRSVSWPQHTFFGMCTPNLHTSSPHQEQSSALQL